MALEKYNVIVNGMETVLQLSPKDAEARGLTGKNKVGARGSTSADLDALAAERAAAAAAEAEEAAAKEAAEQAAAEQAAADKAAADKAAADKKAAEAPANKSRTAANKQQ